MKRIRGLQIGELEEMKEYYDGTYRTIRELAKRFGYSATKIRYVLNYKNFREEQKARNKKWCEENREKHRQNCRNYNQRNKERLCQKNKDYYQRNREKLLQYCRDYYQRNKNKK